MDFNQLKTYLRIAFEAGGKFCREAEEALAKHRPPDLPPPTSEELVGRRNILKAARIMEKLSADVDNLDEYVAEDYLEILNSVSVPEASFYDGTFANVLVHINKPLPGYPGRWQPKTVNEFIEFLTKHASTAKAN